MKTLIYFLLLICMVNNSRAEISATATPKITHLPPTEFATIKKPSWTKRFTFVSTLRHDLKNMQKNTLLSENYGGFIYQWDDTLKAEDSSIRLATVGGGRFYKSSEIYLTLGIESIELKRKLKSISTDPEGEWPYFENSQEEGNKFDLSIFATHRINTLLSGGTEIYYEKYKTDYEVRGFDDIETYFEVTENYSGEADGARLFSNINYTLGKTNLFASYSYNYDEFKGAYFGASSFRKRSLLAEIAIEHRWAYGVSTEITYSKIHDRTFEQGGFYFMGPQNRKSSITQIGAKKLITEHLMLSFNYMDFDFGVEEFSLSLNHRIGKTNQSKRRKRHNRLMRNPAL